MRSGRPQLNSDINSLPTEFNRADFERTIPIQTVEGRILDIDNGDADADSLPSIQVVPAELLLKVYDGPANSNTFSNWPSVNNSDESYPYRDFAGNDQTIGDLPNWVVTAYPSLQAMEWLARAAGDGTYDRTVDSGNDIWRILLTEVYKKQDSIRIYRVDTVWLFDVPPEPVLLVRLTAADTEDGNYTGQVLETQLDSGDFKENGSISVQEINGTKGLKTGDEDGLIVEVTMDRWNKRPYFTAVANSKTFLGLVQGNTSSSANIWTYDIAECDCGGTLIDGGRTGSSVMNGMEKPNSASGMQGNGVNVDDFPVGGSFAISPITTGTIVFCFDCGDDSLIFSSPNGVTGTCTGG